MVTFPRLGGLIFFATFAFLLSADDQSCAEAAPTGRPGRAPIGCVPPGCLGGLLNRKPRPPGTGQQPRPGQHGRVQAGQGQQPGQAPGQRPGQAPGQRPGQRPGQAPGQRPGQAPRPGPIPGMPPASSPGSSSGSSPGSPYVPLEDRLRFDAMGGMLRYPPIGQSPPGTG
uniref:Uncharacterized protein n=1 Tax=Rhipicephalus appendiculatus TaxID=34631 RepID=A0A131YF74_RHIAP